MSRGWVSVAGMATGGQDLGGKGSHGSSHTLTLCCGIWELHFRQEMHIE